MHRSPRRSRTLLGGIAAALLASALMPGVTAAASYPLSFTIYLGDSCVSGRGTEGRAVQILWKSGNGALKASASRVVADDGSWEVCKSGQRATSFDTVWVNDGVSANAITLPELTLVQNRVDDLYRGRGPAGQYVRLSCGWCMWTGKLKVSSQGKWSFKPGWDVRGNQRMTLIWRRGDDFVATTNISPYVRLTIGSPKVSGATRNGAPFTVVVKKGNTMDVRGTATGTAFTFNGEFNGKLRNQSGNLVNVRVGDLVTSDVSSDVDWMVDDIPVGSSASSGEITGICHSAERVSLLVYRDGQVIDGDTTYTDAYGDFYIDYLAFQAGDRIEVSCEYTGGDWVGKFITAAS